MNLNWHQFAHAASDAAGIPWRPVARCALLCAVLVLAGGCSWVPFWPGGAPDPGVDRHVDPGEMSSALSATSAEMASAPLEPYWPYRMGELYAAVDSTTEAVAHLRAALELDTGYSPAAALLSKLYYQMGNHTDAVQLLEGFIAENDAAPDALRAALALHLEALGEVERAQAVLDGCSGDSRAVREARTFVTLRGDDMAAALESATRSLEENPNSAANHNNYGIALLYAGRPV
ncbi:MAG: tetratricopeptide repeat protein, partial [Candidatus Latescibacterota bacterium]